MRTSIRFALGLILLLCVSASAAAQSIALSQLSPAQRNAIRADMADTVKNPDFVNKVDTQIAALYSLPASPTFWLYRTAVPIDDIRDNINWSNMTPVDPPDGTQTWLNRSTAAQGKQFNLQLLLTSGTGTINAARANIRSGLTDALTNFPTGAGGALLSGGWGAVRDNALARPALRIEKLLATATVQQDGSTAAKAATATAEGTIDAQTISDLLAGK